MVSEGSVVEILSRSNSSSAAESFSDFGLTVVSPSPLPAGAGWQRMLILRGYFEDVCKQKDDIKVTLLLVMVIYRMAKRTCQVSI